MAVLAAATIGWADEPTTDLDHAALPPALCRPLETAWALRVLDAVIRLPVVQATTSLGSSWSGAESSDSTRVTCVRSLVHDTATIRAERAGHVDQGL